MLRRDSDKTLFNYGYSEAKCKLLLCSAKVKMSNAFIGACSNKQFSEISNERNGDKFPKIFFFLPNTTDRKEVVNQYLNNVSLSPIDWRYDDFKKFSPNDYEFNSADLLLKGEERRKAVPTRYNVFKHIIELSYSNLIINADYLIRKSPNIDSDNIKWIDKSQKRFDSTKFKLSY